MKPTNGAALAVLLMAALAVAWTATARAAGSAPGVIDFESAQRSAHVNDLKAAETYYGRVISNLRVSGELAARARYFRALIRFQRRAQDAGMADLNEALRLDPGQEQARLFRAVKLMQLGRTDQARADLDIYLTHRPEDGHARKLLAVLGGGSSKPSQGSTAAAASGGGGAQGAPDPQTAQLLLDRLTRLLRNPQGRSYKELYDRRGRLWLSLGRADRALNDFNSALASDGNYAPALYNRSLAWEKLDNMARALADIRAYLRLVPGNPYGRQRLKKLEAMTGGGSGSRAASVGDPVLNTKLHSALAVQINSGRLNRQQLAEAWDELGRLELEMGRREEALAAFGRALKAAPNYAPAYWNRSMAEESRGRLDQALADVKRYLQYAPNSDYGRKRLEKLSAMSPSPDLGG